MIQTYSISQKRLHSEDMGDDPDLHAVWIDLLNPVPDEVRPIGADVLGYI